MEFPHSLTSQLIASVPKLEWNLLGPFLSCSLCPLFLVWCLTYKSLNIYYLQEGIDTYGTHWRRHRYLELNGRRS